MNLVIFYFKRVAIALMFVAGYGCLLKYEGFGGIALVVTSIAINVIGF